MVLTHSTGLTHIPQTLVRIRAAVGAVKCVLIYFWLYVIRHDTLYVTTNLKLPFYLVNAEGRPREYETRVTLIENFASRNTVKEKLNDRRIAEPPMDENSKKVWELTEAMRAERDIRIRNRVMAVLGVLKDHSTKIASDFADVDQRMVQLWVADSTRAASVASGTPPVEAGLLVQGTGGSGNWLTGLPARTCSPRESCETGYAGDWMPDTACVACAGSCASSGSRPRGLL